LLKDNTVLKITDNRKEANIAKQMVGKTYKHLANIYDFGITENGDYWFINEYIPKKTKLIGQVTKFINNARYKHEFEYFFEWAIEYDELVERMISFIRSSDKLDDSKKSSFINTIKQLRNATREMETIEGGYTYDGGNENAGIKDGLIKLFDLQSDNKINEGRTLLDESLKISELEDNIGNTIIHKLEDSINKEGNEGQFVITPSQVISDNNITTNKEEYNFWGTLTITYTIGSEFNRSLFHTNITEFDDNMNPTNLSLDLNLTFDRNTWRERIQHEVNHFREVVIQTKNEDRKHKKAWEKSDRRYDKYNQYRGVNNNIIRALSQLFSIGDELEIHAYTKQSYYIIKKYPVSEIDNSIKATPIYQFITLLDRILKSVDKWDNENLIYAKNLFYDKGMSVENFKKTVKTTCLKLMKKYEQSLNAITNKLRNGK